MIEMPTDLPENIINFLTKVGFQYTMSKVKADNFYDIRIKPEREKLKQEREVNQIKLCERLRSGEIPDWAKPSIAKTTFAAIEKADSIAGLLLRKHVYPKQWNDEWQSKLDKLIKQKLDEK